MQRDCGSRNREIGWTERYFRIQVAIRRVIQDGERHDILVMYYSISNYPKTEWLKPTNIYHLIVSVGQESEHCFVGCL